MVNKMPTGTPKNGINLGWFKKGSEFWVGRKHKKESIEKIGLASIGRRYVNLGIESICDYCEKKYIKSSPTQLYCKICIPNSKASTYMNKYGISYPEYLKMIEECSGICEICQNSKATHLDHNHKTGKVRGILCSSCNVLLGAAKEDINTLKRSIEYLERNYGK